MSLLISYQTELFSSIEKKDLTTFRKTFLEFDYYVLSLRPETADRKYLKQCFETYQELYTAVLLHSLTDFYKVLLKSQNNILNMAHKIEQNLIFNTIHVNIDSILQFYSQSILYAFIDHLKELEKEHKINLVIISISYLFYKDTNKLPDNLLEHVLLKYKLPFAHYHFILKIISDFYGDDFFQNEEVVSKLILTFKMIEYKKADEVICTIGQLAIDRESINFFKAIEKALDKGNIQSKGAKFTSELLKYYLNNFNVKNSNLKGIMFLNKTLKTGDKLDTLEE